MPRNGQTRLKNGRIEVYRDGEWHSVTSLPAPGKKARNEDLS
ncbi:MAG: hypothetical protein ABW328_06215 [Ilumatobacteraceae bacterium]